MCDLLVFRAVLWCLLIGALSGCRDAKKDVPAPAPQPSPDPYPSQQVLAVNNPNHRPAYTGARGSVEGVVTVQGDAAWPLPKELAKIPSDCENAKETYGKLFREGEGRTLADVLVAVTGYDGYVTAAEPAVLVTARGCAWDRRTIALAFGQRIEVQSLDQRAYIPMLLGGKPGANLVAVPKGSAVPVFPRHPGHYMLVDEMRLFSRADVFVLRYPTYDVTGLDGRFHIAGIPVGKVKVTALLPSINQKTEASVDVTADAVKTVNLVIPFDQADFERRMRKTEDANSPPTGSTTEASATVPAPSGSVAAPRP